MKRLIAIIIIVNSIFGCQNSQITEEKFRNELRYISFNLRSVELDKIKKVSTVNGFKSLMDWSDSLSNKDFIINISKNLESGIFRYTNPKENVFELMIDNKLENNKVVTGMITLIVTNNRVKIEEFWGETIVY